MTQKIKDFTKPLVTKSIVSQIVTQITDMIILGKLKPGQKLPTETDLCDAFHVGRNSVREAIKILEAYGIVYIKRADGTFINDQYSPKMLDPMLYGILLEKNFGDDIIKLRKVIDIGILYSVISQVTETQIAQLKKSLDYMETLINAPTIDSNTLFQADVDFHRTLAEMTENHLLLSVYTYVDKITSPSRKKTMDLIISSGKLDSFLELHQKIVVLLEQKNLIEIETILTEHNQFWDQIM